MIEEVYKHVKTLEPLEISKEGLRQYYFSYGYNYQNDEIEKRNQEIDRLRYKIECLKY